MPDIELPAARRHLREVEDRLARQQALVAEMEAHNDARAIELGREFLAIMQATADIARRRVERLETLVRQHP